MLTHYGRDPGVRIARKHLGWYSKGLPGSAEFRAAVNQTDDVATGRGVAAPVLRTADRTRRRARSAARRRRGTPGRRPPLDRRGRTGRRRWRPHAHAAEARPVSAARHALPAARCRAAADRLAEPGPRARPPGHRALCQPGGRAVFRGRRRRAGRPQAGRLLLPHSPVLALADTVWRTGGSIAEYDVPIEGPRLPPRSVTIQGAPAGEGADLLVLMLHERSMADKMDRQLTHRNAARSVTAMAAMLAHEVKNPLSGIRGAAQLLEQDADPAGARADPADLRGDRPHRRAGRPHRGVFRLCPDQPRRGQHPRGARPRAQGGAIRLRPACRDPRRIRSVAAAGASATATCCCRSFSISSRTPPRPSRRSAARSCSPPPIATACGSPGRAASGGICR